jgi:sulfatase modifying factor 1
VRAFKPFKEGSLNDVNYTGRWIGYQSGIDDFTVSDSLLHAPATTSWHYAARMLNWMHNGKVNEKWAFETGVYDTSTFGRDPETNNLTDQPVHSPGAKYWLPTLDEWTKAMYWDPDKNDGEGGYWTYPHGSDEVPLSGLPEDGGETNSGTNALLAVGSYADVTSPWGFLDGSGGDSEWLETLSFGWAARMQKGSSYATALSSIDNFTVNRVGNGFPQFASASFRIVTQIPAPPSVFGLVAAAMLVSRRRRV